MLGKLKFRIAQRGEVIFNEGAVGNFMLFIEKGTMYMEGHQFATKVADGAFLGGRSETLKTSCGILKACDFSATIENESSAK